MKHELSLDIARKVLETVDHGLVCGLGKPVPGQMCIEAAVCFAYGIPHSDNPPCVGSSVREFKIALNDRAWSSSLARAHGMRGIAIAQLGSDVLDQQEFRKNLQKKTIQRLLPKILRIVAELAIFASTGYRTDMLSAAATCEREGTGAAAVVARDVCRAARRHAASDAAAYAACAAYAAYAAASDAASAACAAASAAYAYGKNRAAIRDEWLSLGADICLEVLKEMKSPGCEYLYLLDK